MTSNRTKLCLLAAAVLPLGGCVAGMAASAISMAARSARGQPASNEHLKPEASAACTARASLYGAVKIIDVEQRSASKIIVWGTAGEGQDRRSFECSYRTSITSFKLRAIKPL
ncbi:MAG TPA: hypothetical protein VE403_08360 [Sphingomicrobium sp.]|nr:hypothetical protein [Sphingomicrobium sp.]